LAAGIANILRDVLSYERKTTCLETDMSRLVSITRAAFAAVAAVSLSACLSISDPQEGLSVLSIIGGNNQTIPVSSIAPTALMVQTLDHRAAPMGGVTINWSITSGDGSISAQSTVTQPDGNTAINFTASANPGSVFVRATAEDLRVTFTVNVVAAPPPG
jgi:hypothetical protein